jgi:dihydrofolate reductase
MKDTLSSFILYAACSVDGYIARDDGSADWLSKWDPVEAGYNEFVDSVEGLVMGAKTYDQILTFGDWPYGDKPCCVLSNQKRKPVRDCIEFFAGNVDEVVALFRDKDLKRIWIVGGASIYTQFHRKKYIDDYFIAVIPVILGSGIPIIQSCDLEVRLRLISSRAFNSGLVLNHYQPI